MGTIHNLVEELYDEKQTLMKLWGVEGGQEQFPNITDMAKMVSHSADPTESKKASKMSSTVADVLAGNKKWMQYTTWRELYDDMNAYIEYSVDCGIIRSTYDLDFSEVAKTLAPLILENREYGGLISAVDGKLRTIYIEKSPTDMSDGGASVPGDIVAKISKRPALFFFHTHPAASYNSMPSPADVIGGISADINRHYVAEIIVSTSGVTMYKPSAWLSRKFNNMYLFYSKLRFEAAFINYMLDFIRCSNYNMHGTRYFDDNAVISQLKQIGIDVIIYQLPKYYNEYMRSKSIDILTLNRSSLIYYQKNSDYYLYREQKRGVDSWVTTESQFASETAKKIIEDEGGAIVKSYMFI